MENRFKTRLSEDGSFVISVELVPTRGLMRKDFSELIAFTEAAVAYGKIDALSLTDNPGGNPRLSPDVLGMDVLFRGMSPLVHLTCKDNNRNGLESRAFQLNRMGVQNVLALTGDYPVDGFHGVAKPSFDLDSVGLVRMLQDMNQGLEVQVRPGKFQTLDPTDFYIGASVSPFKRHRAELLGQFIKLEKKVRNGARFIITQLGYDMRKYDELLRYMRLRGLDAPVLGNVYVPHRIVSRIMSENQVPGCVVSPKMLEWVNSQAAGADKGKAAFLEFAARQVAALKGLGYRGAHIGGFGLSFLDVCTVIDLSAQMESQWREAAREIQYPQPEECYFFQRDEETGLSSDTLSPISERDRRDGPRFNYGFMKLVHGSFFEPSGAGFRLARGVCSCVDRSHGAAKTFETLERGIKWLVNRCQGCGDCSLAELAFLCPEDGCPKGMRNGPCGGSSDGTCERKDRKCFWYRVIKRLDKDENLDSVRSHEPVYRNAALKDSSSWLNYYLGRDHAELGKEEKKE